ncbi:GroES-like protein [Trametes coccinea BRFM310]|uniref:GroES-like protein n=1 Tax=Trametes coccinea (strain BRFM310) TaxID=1353009 RepID=A0A1Y2ITN3_TRAC3|nr:GroES-like protein [Trametes coccinea BRFM310]
MTAIPQTMKAAVLVPGNNELVLQDVPVPVPGPKQVLLKVAAAGVCHSDTFLLSATLPDTRTYIPGHENVGYAVKVGAEVAGITVGQLYGIYDAVPCAATANMSASLTSVGIGVNGGFAEYIVVDPSELVPVPSGLAPEVASVASDALLTAFTAVHRVAELGPGTTKSVLIYGCGGLGHLAVQLALYYGATVYVCDFKPAARELALKLGAKQAFDLQDLTSVTSAGTFTVDIVIDFVANEQSFTLGKAALHGHAFAMGGTEPAGRLVLVGFTTDQLSLSSIDLILWRTNVLSVLYGTIDNMKICLNLLAEGIVKPVITTEPLQSVNRILDGLKAAEGDLVGRRIIVPGLLTPPPA